jgi:hypothetical protein
MMTPIASMMLIVGFAAAPFTAAYLYNLEFPLETPDVAWANAVLQRKEELARVMPSPKIVLVGGSSVHFGFQAKRLQAELNRPVFNFGSHASLGPAYQLHLTKRILRRGDTVVLFVEYPNLQGDIPEGGDMLEVFLRRNHDNFPLPKSAHSVIETALQPTLPTAMLLQSLSAIGYHAQSDPSAVPTSHYDPRGINAWGDPTGGQIADVPVSLREKVRNGPPLSCATPPSPIPFAAIRQFAGWAHDNGIQFYAGWSPTYDQRISRSVNCPRFFAEIRKGYESADVQMLGDAMDFIIPFDEILDTPYHATVDGRKRLTKNLAEQFRN